MSNNNIWGDCTNSSQIISYFVSLKNYKKNQPKYCQLEFCHSFCCETAGCNLFSGLNLSTPTNLTIILPNKLEKCSQLFSSKQTSSKSFLKIFSILWYIGKYIHFETEIGLYWLIIYSLGSYTMILFLIVGSLILI